VKEKNACLPIRKWLTYDTSIYMIGYSEVVNKYANRFVTTNMEKCP
jgi:hypothetical protein